MDIQKLFERLNFSKPAPGGASGKACPTKLKISTITAVGSVGTPVNLRRLFDAIELCHCRDGSSGWGWLSIKLGGEIRRAKGDDDAGSHQSVTSGSFGNQATLVFWSSEGIRVNTKVFLNGRVQMTGLKAVDQGPLVLKALEAMLRVVQKGVVDDPAMLRSGDYAVCLINSDFDIGFKIKRTRLVDCLMVHYPDIICSYEPCIYPGVKIKYMWNRDRNGVCRCAAGVCSGKGGGLSDGCCRKVTVAVFQSGKVIITGAHTEEQLNDAYEFLVGEVVRDHSDEFRLDVA